MGTLNPGVTHSLPSLLQHLTAAVSGNSSGISGLSPSMIQPSTTPMSSKFVSMFGGRKQNVVTGMYFSKCQFLL